MARFPRIHDLIMARFPRTHGRRRRPRRLRGAVSLGLLLAAALASAAALAAPSGRVVTATTRASTSTAASGSPLPSLSYLRAHAKYDFAGWHLARHRATTPPMRSAIPMLPAASTTVPGLDVSAYQGNVNWSAVKANGAQFAYIKATEGTYYTNPYFAQQYNGSYNVGLVRGAYAFAIPNYSSGASQADYLANHGGAWSADGKTLPAALDIEYNPYGGECYGLGKLAMRSWITAFLNRYHTRTGRWAVIYSTTDWWTTCTGNYGGYAGNDPLWIARYASTAGTLPAGWSFYTFWQYADSGIFPGDQDVFNGSHTRLVALANNT